MRKDKWAVYCRVSDIDQHPENQEIILRDWIARRGIENHVFFEEKESTRKTRPVKQELLRRVRNAEFTGILVLRLGRWARSLSELIPELEYFGRNNVLFVSLQDLGEINLNTAYGRFTAQILGAFNEFERELISERTREGLARVKKRGGKLGRPKGSKDKKKRKSKNRK